MVRPTSWLPLAVLGLLVGLTLWLNALVQAPAARASGALRHDPDLMVENFNARKLDANGQPDLARGWKDTVDVPRESSLRFAIRFDNPGDWMFHCHILEHAERGMMSMLHVRP